MNKTVLTTIVQKNKIALILLHVRKKLLSGFVLTGMLLMAFNSFNSSAADIIFKDVNGHWAQADIGRAVDAGYVKGYSDATFRPDMPVKRSEFITMLNAAFDVPKGGTGSNFLDVHENDWFAPDVWSAVNAGYMDIYTDNILNPNLPIPRQEAAALTANLAGFTSDGGVAAFNDEDSIAEWACKQIDALVTAGVMDGYPDGTFRPDGKITRGEAVALINRAVIYAEGEKLSASLRVTGSIVNIRSGPDTSYGILKKVYSGDVLEASLLSSNKWYRVDAGGMTGWIIGSYVDVQNTDKSPASGENTNSAGQDSTKPGSGESVSRGGEAGRDTEMEGGTKSDEGTAVDNSGTDNPGAGSTTDTGNAYVPAAGTVQYGSNGKLIVIDAGHGGYDDGAKGPSGTREKDVTLAIALKLMEKLRSADYGILLTRSDDTYVSLPDRSLTANNANASIFVSIHCNSSEYHTGHGTEVYTEPAGSKPVYKQQEESMYLAGFVQAELTKALGLTDRGTKEKDLAVCRETNLPAILVETAFIDNREEEMLLSEPSFQDKAASAIKQGIDSYFSGR